MTSQEINKVTGLYTSTNINTQQFSFVTGGTGLVGSCLIKHLVQQGKNVKALYRTEIPQIITSEKVQWVQGDILDVIALDGMMQNVDHVYHCAAIVSFSPKTKQQLFQTNINGTANIVDAALRSSVRKLCFVSSVAALGRAKNAGLVNETICWSEELNDSNYGKSKYLGEVEVWRGIAEGLEAVIVNPSIILGSGKWTEGSTKLFKKAYEEFPWYTEGSTGFVDVEDLVKAMIQLMDSPIKGEKFIVSAENRLYKDIFTLAAVAFGKKAPHKRVSRLIANMIWRLDALRSIFSGEEPLVTQETAVAAQTVVAYDNSKLLRFLPAFTYTPLEETVRRVCAELQEKNTLN